ncbi:hypothetical protein KFE98_18095 [bacterium SCSIO 12741]|nr:hypothetical protein KFE98_18095 [bacterium SCSIO 12741]
MPTINLTHEQWEQIKKDAEGTQMLKPNEVEAIAARINERRNLPFLSEEKEFIVYVKIVRRLDQLLYENLPNEIYSSIRYSENGLDPQERKRMIKSLTRYINKQIDIPYLNEMMEKFIIRAFLSIIVNALLKNKNLDISLQEDIPDEE